MCKNLNKKILSMHFVVLLWIYKFITSIKHDITHDNYPQRAFTECKGGLDNVVMCKNIYKQYTQSNNIIKLKSILCP